jgi:uncharacterized protein (DUF1330 family)
MRAYVIANIDVTNPESYEGYKAAAASSIALYGGRYIARGGRTEVLDGDVSPKRIALLEFPDVATAKRWYVSPEYQAALPLRVQNSISSAVLVEGLPD